MIEAHWATLHTDQLLENRRILHFESISIEKRTNADFKKCLMLAQVTNVLHSKI